MKHLKLKSLVFAIAGLAGLNATASEVATPLSFSNANQLTAISEFRLDSLDNLTLMQRDSAAHTFSGSMEAPSIQFAEPQAVSISPDSDWESIMHSASMNTDASVAVWRKRIVSEGALSINLGFNRFHMPEGGSLHIYTPDQSQRIRPFTSADNDDHGQLWTPMLKGDTVIIELNIPHSKLNELELELTSINHGYLGSDMASIMEAASVMSGSCNIDVVCPQGDGWRDQIRSVAAISTGGSRFCTGSALNNTANDGRGFFLTADHCGINSSNAASLVTYWNFENSTCRTPGGSDSGGQGNGPLDQFNTGAIFRASYSNSDMTLVELDDPFNPAHNVYLAGWDASTNLPYSVVAIHHPSVDEKRISFENDPVTVSSYLGDSSPGNGTHIRVADWDLGTTEGGSSGSPLFNDQKRVIGQLHGGYAACGNDRPDWYGWLNISWTGGGTNSTRLSNWLDPTGSGATAIDGRNASGGTPGNQNPTANANGPYSALINESISFSSAGSNDTDGSIAAYSWNFGDGTSSTSANPSHTYSATGTYTATLTVTDDKGATGTSTAYVTITSDNEGNMDNGIPVSNISGSSGTEHHYYIDVPAGASNLTFDTSGGSGDADLYVRFGSKPNTDDWDCRPYDNSGTENCTFATPQTGRYYVMVRAYGNISGYQLVAKFDIDTTPPGNSSFEDTNVSVSAGNWKYYELEVTAGMSSIVVTTTGNNGDADLYVRRNSKPTTNNYACRSWSSSSNESCTINNPEAGTWHVGVRAYESFSGLTVKGEAK